MQEGIALDPKEFVPLRAELSLHELGLEVRSDGADWGEADIAAQLARQAIGASVTDRHLEPVEMTIPIMVREESGVSLAEAAYKLQQKVGLWQQEGENWMRRDFSDAGGFAGSVGYQVLKASITGLQGWMMAHRQEAPEVTLKILRGPLCYATTEVESATFSETVKRELIWELSEVLGTAPGLIRVIVKNNNSTGDWRGLVSAIESRDYTKGATAEPAYACTALTRKGGATEAEREGEKVVRHSALTTGWINVLESKIAASGHMTHRGVRRLHFRIFDPGAAAGNVQLRLRWRALGTLQWSENDIQATPLVGGWSVVDLGEARPEIAAVGNERWEWQVLARAVNGSGAIDLARVRIYPTEQMAVVRAPRVSLSPDAQSTKAPTTAASVKVVGGGAWENPTNALTSDNAWAISTLSLSGLPVGSQAASQSLQVATFGFPVPVTATITGVAVEVERSMEGEGKVFDKAIYLATFGQESEPKADPAEWSKTDEAKVYGGSTDLWGLPSLTPAEVNEASFAVFVSAKGTATGLKARVDAVPKVIVYYTEANDENRVAFASRSIEFRTDDVVRQHPSEDIWGRVVPEGSLPYAPSSGLEKRPMRGILAPSQGDLGELSDEGTNPLSAVVKYRPAYLFAREAA